MSDLVVHPVALVGGLESSKARPEPGDFQKLENFAVFRGRFALRAPLFLVQETGFLDDQGTPQPITHLLASTPHINKLYVVGYSSSQQKCYLYECGLDGSSPTRKGTFVWSGLSVPPRPVLASFEGGSATAGTARLYIADYDEQQNTMFWDGTTINTLQADFSGDDVLENVKFHYVIPYQFHVWGAGFLQGTTARKELLRFSQPGLIPAADADNPTDPTELREWHINDSRPVGRRGDKVTTMGLAGGALIVYKYGQTYALFGYDRDSWAIRMLTERSGAVGPYASASTGDGLSFAWAERGPIVTNGQTVDDSISESIRKHVLEAEISDKTCVAFSPDDGLVYFIYPRAGSTEPNRWLAFDKERKLWTEGEWLAQGGGILQTRHAFAIPPSPPPPAPGQPGALPGPVAAPASLVLTVVDEDEITLAWTNGDIALDTVTEIYRGTSPNPTAAIATVTSGVASYEDSGLVAKTPYYYRLRHKRNGVFSGYSNEPNAKTTLARPTGFAVSRLSNGIRVSMTNNEAGADIVIERQTPPGSGAFVVRTTLVAQASGTITFDDTTATCNTSYEYRAKVTLVGQTNSLYSSVASTTACLNPSITTVSHSASIGDVCSGIGSTRVLVNWTGVNLKSSQRVKVYRNVAGGGFGLVADVSADSLGYADDSWPVYAGASARSLQYRLDLEDGGIVVDQDTTTLTNHNVQDCLLL